MIDHEITESSSLELGYGLDNCEWKKVLTNLIESFGNFVINLQFCLCKWHSNPWKYFSEISEAYDDEEARLRIFHMSTACKLALKEYSKIRSLDAHNESDTQNSKRSTVGWKPSLIS